MLEKGQHFGYCGPCFVLQFGPTLELNLRSLTNLTFPVMYLLANDNSTIYSPVIYFFKKFYKTKFE